jgi:hypothetical protein
MAQSPTNDGEISFRFLPLTLLGLLVVHPPYLLPVHSGAEDEQARVCTICMLQTR